jgi:hypothetical protein
MAFAGGWHFEAQMHYELIRDDGAAQWRVSTRAYRYRLAHVGHDIFRIHWHPAGVSTYHLPHVHLSLISRDEQLTTLDEHLPTGRLTFEDAIEWAIETGVPRARDDWRDVLAFSRERHLEHRSWSTRPPN